MFKDVLDNIRKQTSEESTAQLWERDYRFAGAVNKAMGRLQGHEKIRIQPGDWFRTSSLYFFTTCPRQVIFTKESGEFMYGDMDERGMWAVAVGRAYHSIFQNEVLSRFDYRDVVVLGAVEDDKVVESFEDLVIYNRLRDGKEIEEYREFRFEDSQWRVTGHCDGILVWRRDEDEEAWMKAVMERDVKWLVEHGDMEVLELKTIGDTALVSNGPKEDHVLQVSSYMLLIERMFKRLGGNVNIEGARVVYIGKSIKDWREFVEWKVGWNEDRRKDIEAVLTEIRWLIDEATLEDIDKYDVLPICKRKGWRYYKCPFAKVCLAYDKGEISLDVLRQLKDNTGDANQRTSAGGKEGNDD